MTQAESTVASSGDRLAARSGGTRRRLSVAIQRLDLVRERAEPKEIYALASLRLMNFSLLTGPSLLHQRNSNSRRQQNPSDTVNFRQPFRKCLHHHVRT